MKPRWKRVVIQAVLALIGVGCAIWASTTEEDTRAEKRC